MVKLKFPNIKIQKLKLVLISLISLIFVLTYHLTKPNHTTINDFINISNTNTNNKEVSVVKDFKKLKATFVILARNSELSGWLSSMKELEERFNKKYNYPYVFLNDKNFTIEFKEQVKANTNAEVKFGIIPKDQWSLPGWINKEKYEKVLKNADYMYGDSESYRHMCRYESGFFFRHPLLDEYEYYWRVEPDVNFYCDINFDPFKFLFDNNKKYGFTITMTEEMLTIPTLMETVDKYIVSSGLHNSLPKDSAKEFIRYKDGASYNGCHFWTNFEIASFDIWRSKEYLDFFDYLDNSGGFFYERWGDAPIHSIYMSLFHSKEDLHFFEEIGYEHSGRVHCPIDPNYSKNNCSCNKDLNHDFQDRSCMSKYLSAKTNKNYNFFYDSILHI